MIRRHTLLSLIICSLVFSSPARGQDTYRAGQVDPPVTGFDRSLDLDESISLRPSLSSSQDWVDSVTMTRLPPGSLITRFEGFHGFVMKQLRGQCRQFVKQATDRGWYVQPDQENRVLYWSSAERDWVGMNINGAWWTRSWMESLTPEAGGAPAAPHIHAYGHEHSWRRGPIKVTNTFKFRFDYIAFFELNPDPVEPQGQVRQSPISIDVQADEELLFGTTVLFKIRPRIRFGLPKDMNLTGLVKGASVEVAFEINRWNRTLMKGDVQVQWRGGSDFAVAFDLAVVAW